MLEKITRWVVRRKMELLAKIDRMETTESEVCSFYNISPEEIARWRDLRENYGQKGLRVTRIKQYRENARKTLRESLKMIYKKETPALPN